MLGGHKGVTVQAIETVYNGYRFRSRLEARWAVFFDALNVQYQYEPEGFDLGEAGWYLPDFWLPGVSLRGCTPGVWIEIKASEPSTKETWKCSSLAEQTRKPVVLFVGPPACTAWDWDRNTEGGYQFLPEIVSDRDGNETVFVLEDNLMTFMRCYVCGAIKIEYPESSYVICPRCNSRADWAENGLLAAYIAARQARFDHGEHGRPPNTACT